MPRYSLEEIDAVIKNRIKYFLQLRAYLAEMKSGKIAADEVDAFLYDHLCARVEAGHGLVDKRENVLNSLESIATRKLAAYNMINKAFHQPNKEVAITTTVILVQYQLQYSQDDKHKSHFHDVEGRAPHVFHEHDIFKLLDKQMRFHTPKWFLKFWKCVYFSSDQRFTLDGEVGLSVRVAIDRQVLGDELIALMKVMLEQTNDDSLLKKSLLEIDYRPNPTFPSTKLFHHMQKVTSPEYMAKQLNERKKAQRRMAKETQTSLLVGRSADEFELMSKVYEFVSVEVKNYYDALLDYEKLTTVLEISRQNLLARNLSNKKIMQAYQVAITQINSQLSALGALYPNVLPLVLQMEEKLTPEAFELERARLVSWAANFKKVGSDFDDKMFQDISVEEIEMHANATQLVIDQLKLGIEQYQADAIASLSKVVTPVAVVDEESCESEDSDNESENVNEHAERTLRWKKQVSEARASKQQVAASRQDSSSSSTSTSVTEPEPDEVAVAMKKRIAALKPHHRNLICDILESSQSVRYNSLCALLPKLGAKLKENGGGSHKTIEFSLYAVEIYSACSDTRKQEAQAAVEFKAKGGIFRQHRNGDYTPKLCPFNLRLLSDLFAKVGITKELMLSLDECPTIRDGFVV